MIDAAERPIGVAMDLTALVGPVTGVGQVVLQLATRLPQYPSLDLTGLLVSWRGRRELAEVIPPGWAMRPLMLPARLAHLLWSRFDRPRLHGFDLVHGPNYVVPPTEGAVRIVTVHDLTAWRYPELVDDHSRTFPRQLSLAVDQGAHVHTVSNFVAVELEDELGLDPERIHVVHNGVAHVGAGDGRRGRDLVGGPYVLAIGTVEPRKDYATLIRAMDSIWPIFPDLRLAIAGPEGWGSDDLDRVVEELGAGPRVRRLGYVSDAVKADLLHGAEALAFPSLYEGFGLPVLEAMQVGLPVVASRAGAIPEVVGRAGVLVEPRDPPALAGALLAVLEDDELRASLGAAGRQRAGNFSWDRSANQLVSVYHHLTGREQTSPPPTDDPDRGSPEDPDLGGASELPAPTG